MLCRFRGLPRRTRLVLGALFLLGTACFFGIDSGYGYRGPRVDGDGVYFWLYLRSIAVDGDVNFRNDYERWGNPWGYGNTARGLPMNPTTLGTALLWAPFYLPARCLVLLAVKLGAALPTDGTSRIEELSAFYGSFLYGFLAILLCLRLGRRHFPETPALVGAVGASVGGMLVFYMVVQPSYSHAAAAFVTAAFVERWDTGRPGRSWRGWLVLGALGGLAALVRPQLAVLALLPLCDLLRWLASRWTARKDQGGVQAPAPGRQLLGAALAALAALAVFSPQMVCWQIIHGRPLVIPQGASFMQWGQSLWSEALFHPRAGLVPWMPLALPAILGLLLLARRQASLGVPLLLLLLATAYVNGASWDWWAGYSFGARRFTYLTAILALGLSCFAHSVWCCVTARPRAFAAGALLVSLGALLVLNLSMLWNRRFGQVDWYRHPQFYKVYGQAIDTAAAAVYNTVGNPLSWPASLAFAARYGVSPSRYDLVAGRYFLEEGHPVAHPLRERKSREDLKLAAPALAPFLASGFGEKRRTGGREVVAVRGSRACLLLPLLQRPELRITLSGRARPAGAQVEARWNGRVLGEQELAPRFGTISFTASHRLLRRGVNQLCLGLRPKPAPVAAPKRSIGSTGVWAPVDLTVVSAGLPAGDFSRFWVAGRSIELSRRGVNAVAVSAGGRILGNRHFDFCHWPQAGEALLRWIDGFPNGTLVLLGVRTDASRLFTPAAREALRRIGAATDLRGKPRHSYAAIGVRGAPPSSALEAVHPNQPVSLTVGEPPREFSPAAELEGVTLEVIRPMRLD